MPAANAASIPAAVVFDLDGLMIDSERLDRLGWYAVAAKRGFVMTDDLHGLTIGRREADVAAEFKSVFGPHFDFAAAAGEVRAWREAYVARHGMPQKSGLTEMLDHLDTACIPYGVATSTAREPALKSMGSLADRMHAAVFGEDVVVGKPAPDVYLLAAQRLAVAPNRCLALEDSLPGVAAAEAAGMTVIMIPDLVVPEEGIRYVCESLLRVRDWMIAAGAVPSACSSAD